MDPYAPIYQEFLSEQPQWLAHDVKYLQLPDEDEPSMALSAEAVKAFVQWVMAKGIVGKPEKLPAFVQFMDAPRRYTAPMMQGSASRRRVPSARGSVSAPAPLERTCHGYPPCHGCAGDPW